EFAGVDFAQMGLVPIRTATLGPMVFGCLDAAAPPFAEWAGDLASAMPRVRAEAMELAFEFTYDVAVNWKVYVENGLEGYHVAVVHDFLNDLVSTKDAEHHFEQWGSYTHAKIKPEFVPMFPRPATVSEADASTIRFGHLFPNLIPVLHATEFSYLRIDPLGPEHIRLTAKSFDPGGEFAGLREMRQEPFDRTNKQDIAVVERVQQGLRARGLPAGVHSSFLECRIGHFERMVSRELGASS